MRKFYHDFFYIPKHGKIREKVMVMRVAVMAMIMVFCLAAMSITAYAYFSCNVTSGSNLIKSVSFELSVQISDESGQEVDIVPVTSDYKSYLLEGLEVGKYYNISVKLTDSSTAATGFATLSVEGCENTYHTQQLYINPNPDNGETSQLDFKLMITDSAKVVLNAHWGTSSYFDDFKNKGDNEELYITQGQAIKVIVNGVVEPTANTNDEISNNDTVENIIVPENETTTDATEETITEETEKIDNSLEQNDITE